MLHFLLFAADLVHPAPAVPGNGSDAMMANSPFTTYAAGVALYVLVTMVLVLVLLIGGFLIVNLGMMSKREQDKTGQQEPSDVGILNGERFPGGGNIRRILPPEEDENQPIIPRIARRFDRRNLLSEELMAPEADMFERRRKAKVGKDKTRNQPGGLISG